MEFTFHTYTPCAALQPYIKCYLHLKGNGHDAWRQHLIPSNIQTLGFIFSGSIHSSLAPEPSSINSFVLGQLQRPVTVDFKADVELITVFFRSTGMYRLFGIPMQLFADRAMDLESVCRRQDRIAIQKILHHESVEKRVAAIEALMLKKLSDRSDRHLDHIEYASRLILSHNGNLPVGQLAREVNMSKRNLERHFIGKVGVSPKSFSCIARIKNVLELILHPPALAWKDVSQKLEYADPAHFFHEFKKFTGTTPREFFQSITDFDHFLYAG